MRANDDGTLAGNQIKTGNRLVGNIENNELYGADDDVPMLTTTDHGAFPNDGPFFNEQQELMDIDTM